MFRPEYGGMSAQDVLTFAEAFSAAVVPLGGGIAAVMRWHSNARKEKASRAEAARISAVAAAESVRAEIADAHESLVAELRVQIADRDRQIAERDQRIAELTRPRPTTNVSLTRHKPKPRAQETGDG